MIQNIQVGDKIGEEFEVMTIFGGNHQQNIEDESGLGVVYLVRNIDTFEVHALKTFQDRYMNEIDTFDEFKFESLEWIKLNPHPNIVTAIIAEIIEDRPFLFLEPIIPFNNKQKLNHYFNDPLELKQVLDWSIQFCHGMEFINKSGIKVHGDIKPSNILIFLDTVKITDFGLLELFEDNNNHIIEKYYSINHGQGTKEYMAPEVFDGKRSVESDIYSFGVVLFQLVKNGELPFKDDGSHEWQEIHKNTIIPQIDSILNNIIHKCLEKYPNNRYSSFRELRQDLEKIYTERFDNLYSPELIKMDEYVHQATLGHSYSAYGEFDLFEKSYTKALESDDNYVHMMYATDLMTWNKFEDAKNHFKIVVDNYSNSDEEFIKKDSLYYNLGNAYQSLNQIFDAMDYYNKSLNENNNFIKAKVNLGNCYKIIGDFEKSIGYYDDVLEEFPKFYEALYNKALLLCELEDFEEAERIFDRIDENLDKGQRFIDKSMILARTDLKKSLLELLKYFGKYEDIYSKCLLLELHLSMRKFDSAKTTYSDLLLMVDEENYMRILASHLFYDYGYPEYSFEILEKLRTSGSKKCKFESYLLKAYYINNSNIKQTNSLINHIIKKSDSKRQKSEAYNIKFSYIEDNPKYLNAALKLNPYNRDVNLNYITYYLENEKYDKALNKIKSVKDKFKNDPDVYFLEGQIYFNQNDFETAKNKFKLSLKYGKIEPPVYLYIRDCYIKLNDEEKAIKYEGYCIYLDKDYLFRESYKFSC